MLSYAKYYDNYCCIMGQKCCCCCSCVGKIFFNNTFEDTVNELKKRSLNKLLHAKCNRHERK